jgi:hypothetical protein
MSAVEIVQVTNRKQLQNFINLPWKIYHGNPTWVPPLKAEVRRLLDTRKHPFWKFSERVLFLALRGNETVGRICGIVDNNHNRYHSEKMGAWGFFECQDDPEVASALFSEVETWLKTKGMNFLRGPLNPSANYSVGLLIEGFSLMPAIMMLYNPRYYVDLVTACGNEKEKDLFAFRVNREDQVTDRMERLARRIKRHNDITFRTMDPREIDREVKIVKEIYDDAWSENWGFVPMTDDEIAEVGSGLKRIGDKELSLFVYHGETPVGVCLVIADISPLLKRLNGKIGLTGLLKILLFRREITGVSLPLLGVRKDFQKLSSPLSLVAINHVSTLAREKHHYLEAGWTLEDNVGINKLIMEAGGRIHKKFRVYRKEI